MPYSSGGGDDNANVIAQPPLIYLATLAVGIILNFVWPASILPNVIQYMEGAAFGFLGLVVISLSFRELRRSSTNIRTQLPAKCLVTNGIYRLSRNPIYVGLTIIYLAIGISLDNPWIIFLVLPLLIVIRYGVIAREERYLEAKFGDDYRNYKSSTGRWFSRPGKTKCP